LFTKDPHPVHCRVAAANVFRTVVNICRTAHASVALSSKHSILPPGGANTQKIHKINLQWCVKTHTVNKHSLNRVIKLWRQFPLNHIRLLGLVMRSYLVTSWPRLYTTFSMG